MQRGWVRVLLVVVLALSLLGNAVAVGIALRVNAAREAVMGEDAAFSNLPRPVRSAFRQGLAAHRGDLRDSLAAIRTARTAMISAATAKPYDAAAVEAAMQATRTATSALQAQTHQILLDALAGASSP